MNQDFPVEKKKQYLSEKKFVQRVSAAKQLLHKKGVKKRFVQAENSPPPITLLMVHPLAYELSRVSVENSSYCRLSIEQCPVNIVVCQLMMYSNVIVDITISRGSFVFSQSRVKVSASLGKSEHLIL